MNIELHYQNRVEQEPQGPDDHQLRYDYEDAGAPISFEPGGHIVLVVGSRVHADGIMAGLTQLGHAVGCTVQVIVDENRRDLLNENERTLDQARDRLTASQPVRVLGSPNGNIGGHGILPNGAMAPSDNGPKAWTAYDSRRVNDAAVVHDQNFPNREGGISEDNTSEIATRGPSGNNVETVKPVETAKTEPSPATSGAQTKAPG